MKKKKLIFLMASALVSAVLTLSVYAEGTDEISPSLKFAQAIGIMSYDKSNNDSITRLELAESYQYILTGGNAENTNKTTKFKDVFGSSAIDLVSSAGIMTGYDETTFAPAEHVTYIQLMTTMVKFLGYNTLAENAGGYPNGYLSMGTQLGLVVDGVNLNDEITAEKAGKMFRNAADVGLMRNMSVGIKKTYEISDKDTYLSWYLNITPANGIIYGNSTTNLKEDKYLAANQIELNNDIYYVDNKILEIRDKVGYNVKTYVKTISDDEKSIIYYEEKNNNVTEVSDTDVKSISQNRISYYKDNSKTSYIEFNSSTYVIYNGTLCASYDESVLNPFNGTLKSGHLRAVDNNGDGISDVLYVSAYDSYVVENVIDGVIFNKFRSGETLDTGNFREGEIEIVNVMGEPIKFEDISKNDVICVEKNIAGEIKKITVVVDRITGKITQTDFSKNEITVGDTVYELSNSILNDGGSEKLKAGVRAQFYFNLDGKICIADFNGYDDFRWAYITNIYPNEKYEDDGYTAKLFTAEGAFAKYKMAEKVTVGTDKLSDKQLTDVLGGTGNNTVRQVIRYKLNGKNEINTVELCNAANDGTLDGLYQYPGFDGASSRPIYKSGMGSFGAKLLINSDTLIMEVPTEDNRNNTDMYSVKTTSYFRNDDSTILFSAYGTRKNTAVAEMVICEHDAVEEISSYANLVVVDKITDGINSENEPAKVLHALVNGKAAEIVVKDDALRIRPEKYPAPADSAQQTYTYPQKGDVILISQDRNNEIDYAKYVFDNERKSVYYSDNLPKANNRTANPSGVFAVERRFVYGKVISEDNGNITLEIEGYDGSISYESYPAQKFLITKYDAEEDRNGAVSAAAYTDIRSSEAYPEYESYVLIQLRYGDAKCMVIYNGGNAE